MKEVPRDFGHNSLHNHNKNLIKILFLKHGHKVSIFNKVLNFRLFNFRLSLAQQQHKSLIKILSDDYFMQIN